MRAFENFSMSYSSGADEETSDCFFVSYQRGKDTLLCGSFVEPCQTLSQALLMVRDGGKICLDGRNSESHPYSCLPMNSSDEGKIKVIHKSMTIKVGSRRHLFPANFMV